VIKNMKIRCVTYKDKFSAGGKALNDLLIGHSSGIVGCGSKVFGSSSTGDLIVINAEDNKSKHVIIGIILEKIEDCHAWQQEGGHVWPYNFTYKPLTKMFTLDKETKKEIEEIAKKIGVNKHNIFNSRFCSVKCKEIVDMLIIRNKYELGTS
jgi:hypothetical protein